MLNCCLITVQTHEYYVADTADTEFRIKVAQKLRLFCPAAGLAKAKRRSLVRALYTTFYTEIVHHIKYSQIKYTTWVTCKGAKSFEY